MEVLNSVAAVRCFVEQFRQDQGDRTIGLIPTMGALHDGHRSLIERSRTQDGLVIVSIFVNPLQFGPNEDFAQYPQSLDADLVLCEGAGVDGVFLPTPESLGIGTGAEQFQVVPPVALTAGLCGRSAIGTFHRGRHHCHEVAQYRSAGSGLFWPKGCPAGCNFEAVGH